MTFINTGRGKMGLKSLSPSPPYPVVRGKNLTPSSPHHLCGVDVNARPRDGEPLGPSFDHMPWRRSYARRACWRPLSMIMRLFARSFVCFLSRGRKVGLPLEVWQESWPNFRLLPEVSEIATNYWVFLRCDWSPVSSWFYYQS